ncbi:MAG: ABC transporter permease [Herpetosiphonaceae bacterium]|nr:ABC transporter permease [Herpetosiphonaceae bacterium]
MKWGDLISSAASNLTRRKVRTLLTSVGVVVGILTIVTMVSLGIGVRVEINKQFEAIGLERVFVTPPEGQQNFFTQFGRPERTKVITPADITRWQSLPDVAPNGVQADIDVSFGVGSGVEIGDHSAGVGLTGKANFQAPFQVAPTALAGTIDIPPAGGSAVLYTGALKNLKLTVDDVKPLIGQTFNIILRNPQGPTKSFPFVLQGISSDTRQRVELALPDRIKLKSWWLNEPDLINKVGYDNVQVRAKDVASAATVVTEIKAEGYDVQSLETILTLADQVFAVINIMLSSVGGLALLVASLGIVNTMIMSIYERTREIGTLKAIGASRGDIRLMFMLEAGMIGVIGGITGLLGGFVLGKILNRVIQYYIDSRHLPIRGSFFVVTPTLALAAVAFAMLVGIVAGLYPANRAAKLDPLLALRHE